MNWSTDTLTEREHIASISGGQIPTIERRLKDYCTNEDVLPYCQQNGIGFMAYGTLGFGLLTGAFTPETAFVDWDWRSKGGAFGLPLFKREHFVKELRVTERLKALAGRYEKSVAQLAISWVLGHPALTVALVGMRNTVELEENVAAVDWKLSEEDRAEIDRIFAEEDVPTYVDAVQAV